MSHIVYDYIIILNVLVPPRTSSDCHHVIITSSLHHSHAIHTLISSQCVL